LAAKSAQYCATGELFFNHFFESLSTTPASCSISTSVGGIVGELTATPPWRRPHAAVKPIRRRHSRPGCWRRQEAVQRVLSYAVVLRLECRTAAAMLL